MTALCEVAGVVQVRMKDAAASDVMRVTRMVMRVCDAAGAALVINDRVDVALAVGADGVHLGQTDLPIAEARAMIAALGRTMWIGVSTHDVAQVRAARAAGADYLGFGPVFATTHQANPDPVQGIEALAAAVIGGAVPRRSSRSAGSRAPMRRRCTRPGWPRFARSAPSRARPMWPMPPAHSPAR